MSKNKEWRMTWKKIQQSQKTCSVCGTDLNIAEGQVVKYCSKDCRNKRKA